MSEKETLSNSGIAETLNLKTVSFAVSQLIERQASLPGIGVIYGPAGYGKSTACVTIANHLRGYYVQMKSAWNRKTLLEKILIEMSIKPAGTISHMLDQICEQLAASSRPLIVDEFDFCLRSASMVELIRDIYEGSQGALFLVGEENIPMRLKKWERFHSRVLIWLQAQPVSIEDARLLAPIYARNIKIDDELLEYFVELSHGSVRRLVVNLAHAQERAHIKGKKELTLSDWDKRETYTGEAPKARRG